MDEREALGVGRNESIGTFPRGTPVATKQHTGILHKVMMHALKQKTAKPNRAPRRSSPRRGKGIESDSKVHMTHNNPVKYW